MTKSPLRFIIRAGIFILNLKIRVTCADTVIAISETNPIQYIIISKIHPYRLHRYIAVT